MLRKSSFGWVPLPILALMACSDGGPVDLPRAGAFEGDEPLAATFPDLTPEPGTVGTERYLPVLERILHRALGVIEARQGAEAARKVAREAGRLREALLAAREAGDEAALQSAIRALEGFQARVGLRVFGVGLVRHVHADASRRLRAVRVRLKEAADAGRDVSRLVAGTREVNRLLEAARSAAGKGQPLAALVYAAHALDLVTRIGAAL